MRLDFHINIGHIPKSSKQRRDDTEQICTPEEVSAFIEREELTHAVILFTDKNDIRKLKELTNCVLYSLWWIDRFEDIDDLVIDEDCQGICIHSHRGSEKGVDYTKFGRQLKKLPSGCIICVHTQGTTSYENASRGNSVVKWATARPDLKFIIEHAGSYFRTEFYPKINDYNDYINSSMLSSKLEAAIGSEICIKEAMTAANILPNVYVDTSRIHNKNYKSDIINESSSWAWGSDYPFHNGITNYKPDKSVAGTLITVSSQEKIFKKYYNYSDEMIEIVHVLGINWLESSCDYLWDQMIKLSLRERNVNV